MKSHLKKMPPVLHGEVSSGYSFGVMFIYFKLFDEEADFFYSSP